MRIRSAPAASGFVLAIALASGAALGQTTATAPAAATPAVTGLRGDVLWQLTDVEKKLVALAEATPQEKFAWRPAPGVRSISEVYMHVAGGNYFLPTFLGKKAPEGLSRDMEKTVTEKAKVVDAMKKSFDYARKAVETTPDADLDKKIKLFGHDSTERMVLIVMVGHGHEHLGQAIAYARTNGVAPPWSEGPPPAPEKKPATR
jgi:uncharacterized damage-inducible protein DinB